MRSVVQTHSLDTFRSTFTTFPITPVCLDSMVSIDYGLENYASPRWLGFKHFEPLDSPFPNPHGAPFLSGKTLVQDHCENCGHTWWRAGEFANGYLQFISN